MTVILHFLAVLGFCAVGVVLAGWLILRFGRWLDRAENGASGFARPVPYTETSERDESFLRGDFPPKPLTLPAQRNGEHR